VLSTITGHGILKNLKRTNLKARSYCGFFLAGMFLIPEKMVALTT